MPAAAAFTTDTLPAAERAAGWCRAVARSYFPLDLDFGSPASFSGTLQTWELGSVMASRLLSDAVMYRRRPAHLRGAGDEEFLLTIPRGAPVRFLQMGREVSCPTGGFLLERGNEPYEFSYGERNDLIVAKITRADLEARLGDPGRFCAIQFDASDGVAALMVDLLRASGTYACGMSDDAQEKIGGQLVDLVALAIEQHPRAGELGETSVRAAHLRRVQLRIEQEMSNPDLGPAQVAAGCGISGRYLHDLCGRDGASFGERLREARLQAARAALLRRQEGRTITEIAFACGFSDASSFSRTYRMRFDEPPRSTRARARRI